MFVDVFFVNGFRHKKPIGPRDTASVLHANLQRMQSGRLNHLVVQGFDSLADVLQINRLLLRTVWDADPATQVDEFQSNVEPFRQFDGQFKHHFGRLNEEVGVEFIRGDHRVQAEAFDAFRFQ